MGLSGMSRWSLLLWPWDAEHGVLLDGVLPLSSQPLSPFLGTEEEEGSNKPPRLGQLHPSLRPAPQSPSLLGAQE